MSLSPLSATPKGPEHGSRSAPPGCERSWRVPAVLAGLVSVGLAALGFVVLRKPPPPPSALPCSKRPECRAAARKEMEETCKREGKVAMDLPSEEDLAKSDAQAWLFCTTSDSDGGLVQPKGLRIVWIDGAPNDYRGPKWCRVPEAECFDEVRKEMIHACEGRGRVVAELPDDDTMRRESMVSYKCNKIRGAPDDRPTNIHYWIEVPHMR